jgi:cellobiose-specific phosphotransferase system component IIC
MGGTYYIVITMLVFNSLAWWRGVDGRGALSGVIALVIVAGLGVVYTAVLCAGLLVFICETELMSVEVGSVRGFVGWL